MVVLTVEMKDIKKWTAQNHKIIEEIKRKEKEIMEEEEEEISEVEIEVN